MTGSKLAWTVAAAGFLLAALSWALLLNAGSSNDDARSETQRQLSRSRLSLDFVRAAWQGRPLDELKKETARLGHAVDKDYPQAIEIGDLRFEHSGGIITRVAYLDDIDDSPPSVVPPAPPRP